MKNLVIIVLLVLVAVMGCGSENIKSVEPEKQVSQVKKTYCPKQRSKTCTREYMPVCGEPTHKAYSNGCTACADIEVQYYTAGKCE